MGIRNSRAMKEAREKLGRIPGRKAAGFALSKVTVPNIYRFFGLLSIIIAISFYLVWSILYDTWGDVGLYDFVVVLLVFGVLTLLLVDEKEREKRLKEQKN